MLKEYCSSKYRRFAICFFAGGYVNEGALVQETIITYVIGGKHSKHVLGFSYFIMFVNCVLSFFPCESCKIRIEFNYFGLFAMAVWLCSYDLFLGCMFVRETGFHLYL